MAPYGEPRANGCSGEAALDRIPGEYNAKVNVNAKWRWENAPAWMQQYRGWGHHSGGLIRHEGGPIPKMHSGGLRADERMAILQTGEFVMQRSAVRAIGTPTLSALNSGAGVGATTTVVNLVQNVHGSVVTETELFDKAHSYLLNKKRSDALGL